jgi:hypothetical protein
VTLELAVAVRHIRLEVARLTQTRRTTSPRSDSRIDQLTAELLCARRRVSTRPTRCWTRGCTVRAGARVRVADWVCARDALSVRRALTAWRWDALAHAVMSHDRGGARYWRSGCSNRAEGATRISVCPTLSPLESTKETRPATLVGRGAVNTRSMSFA